MVDMETPTRFYSNSPTMFRAPRVTSEWLRFIWEVNERAADRGIDPIFGGKPTLQPDVPYHGCLTENYPEARVIFTSDEEEGVRVVADGPNARAIFSEIFKEAGAYAMRAFSIVTQVLLVLVASAVVLVGVGVLVAAIIELMRSLGI